MKLTDPEIIDIIFNEFILKDIGYQDNCNLGTIINYFRKCNNEINVTDIIERKKRFRECLVKNPICRTHIDLTSEDIKEILESILSNEFANSNITKNTFITKLVPFSYELEVLYGKCISFGISNVTFEFANKEVKSFIFNGTNNNLYEGAEYLIFGDYYYKTGGYYNNSELVYFSPAAVFPISIDLKNKNYNFLNSFSNLNLENEIPKICHPLQSILKFGEKDYISNLGLAIKCKQTRRDRIYKVALMKDTYLLTEDDKRLIFKSLKDDNNELYES